MKMGKICIHDHERKYKVKLESLNEDEKISKRNKAIVIKFSDACLLNGMTKTRILKYFTFFSFLFKFFDKDLDKVTREDIEKIVSVINAKENYSPATKHDCKVLLKRFYKWLLGNDEEYPEQIKWIKSSIKKNEQKLLSEGELITQGDVDKLIEASNSSRDKALVSLLYESGCRIGEIGSMKIGNVSFDKYGTIITVSGKTGPRKMRVVNSTPYLMNWLNVHPLKDDKDSPLWLNMWLKNHHKALVYASFKMILKRLFKKAGKS